MKKVFFLLVVIALFSCEKERCYQCTATCTISGYSATSTVVVCGKMSQRDARDQVMTTHGSGVHCTVRCSEQ